MGRLPHGLRPPRARLRGQRPRARPGGRRGAAGRRAAGGEALGRPAPRLPQPPPRARHPRVHRDGRGASGAAAARNDDWMRDHVAPRADRHDRQDQDPDPGHADQGRDRPAGPAGQAAWRSASRWPAGARRPPPATRSPRRAIPTRSRSSTRPGRSPSSRSTSARTRSRTRSRDAGIGPGDGVAIMCRNHRGFIETVVACSKLGAHALFLNTAFSKPQLTDVLEREEPAALVYDQEFAEPARRRRRRAQALHRLARARGGLRRRAARGPRHGRRHLRPQAAQGAGQGDDPHLGHDGHAEGRQPLPAEVDGPDRRAAGPDPAARRARRR